MKEEKIFLNENIKAKEVILINSEGKNLGKLNIEEAIKLSKENNLDLFQLTDDICPVCKLLDFKKYMYNKKKKEKEQKKKQKANIQELKEIKISNNIDSNDLKIKSKKINELLEKNKKIKISLSLKGRENKDIAISKMKKILSFIKPQYSIEKDLKFEGNTLSIIIIPKK